MGQLVLEIMPSVASRSLRIGTHTQFPGWIGLRVGVQRCQSSVFCVSFSVSTPRPIAVVLHSSPTPAKSLYTSSSHLSRSLPVRLLPSTLSPSAVFVNHSLFIHSTWPVPFIRLVTSFPLKLPLTPTFSLSFSILRLSVFTSAVLLTQLFSQTWTFSCFPSTLCVLRRLDICILPLITHHLGY